MEHLVFVFGTLKDGFPNFATNRGVRIPGTFVTRKAYPLYLVGDRHSPWLIDEPGSGVPVVGELFRVGEDSLEAMDKLERVREPDGYRRVVVEVECSETAVPYQAYAYLKPSDQLVPSQVRKGPLCAYTREHAALYQPRA